MSGALQDLGKAQAQADEQQRQRHGRLGAFQCLGQHVFDHGPIGIAGYAVMIGQHIHAQNVRIEPVGHLAEAVGEAADLAGAVDIDRLIEAAVTGYVDSMLAQGARFERTGTTHDDPLPF